MKVYTTEKWHEVQIGVDYFPQRWGEVTFEVTKDNLHSLIDNEGLDVTDFFEQCFDGDIEEFVGWLR